MISVNVNNGMNVKRKLIIPLIENDEYSSVVLNNHHLNNKHMN